MQFKTVYDVVLKKKALLMANMRPADFTQHDRGEEAQGRDCGWIAVEDHSLDTLHVAVRPSREIRTQTRVKSDEVPDEIARESRIVKLKTHESPLMTT